MNKTNIQEIDFDFGFTAVDEEELEAVQQVTAQAEVATSEMEELKQKLIMLRTAIEPLLKNLEANPEKAYIHWPDRTSKVKAFRSKLDSIQKL
jgi:hypothetical protein